MRQSRVLAQGEDKKRDAERREGEKAEREGEMRISSYHEEFFVSLPRSALLLTTVVASSPRAYIYIYPSLLPSHPPTVRPSVDAFAPINY